MESCALRKTFTLALGASHRPLNLANMKLTHPRLICIVVAALALWFALALIPLAIGAAIIAYLAFRFQLWRSGVSLGGRGKRVRR